MKIMRLSGLPVDPSVTEAYTADWQAKFDVLKEKHGNDMLSLQADLVIVEKELNQIYKVIEDIPYAKSVKQLKALVEKYEAPIMAAKSSENPKEVVYVICDRAI